jgi:hypothetical protein
MHKLNRNNQLFREFLEKKRIGMAFLVKNIFDFVNKRSVAIPKRLKNLI